MDGLARHGTVLTAGEFRGPRVSHSSSQRMVHTISAIYRMVCRTPFFRRPKSKRSVHGRGALPLDCDHWRRRVRPCYKHCYTESLGDAKRSLLTEERRERAGGRTGVLKVKRSLIADLRKERRPRRPSIEARPRLRCGCADQPTCKQAWFACLNFNLKFEV